MQPPKKKRESFGTCANFRTKKKVGGVVPYTSAFHKDLDYRNWKNKNKNKRKRIKMNKNKHKSA